MTPVPPVPLELRVATAAPELPARQDPLDPPDHLEARVAPAPDPPDPPDHLDPSALLVKVAVAYSPSSR